MGSEPITFRKEFQSLPRANPSNSTQAGRRHQDLNNTPHVLPYDATRVILDHDGTGGGDYVNARSEQKTKKSVQAIFREG